MKNKDEFELNEIDEKDWDNPNPKSKETIVAKKESVEKVEKTVEKKSPVKIKSKIDKDNKSDRQELIDLYPVYDVMDEEEQDIYYRILQMYLDDFDKESLSAIDIDGILTLAMNRVLEKRIYKNMHLHPSDTSELMPSIEKLQKQNEKIKESLGQRRKDRIDPRAGGDITILDIVNSFDEARKNKLLELYNTPEDVELRTSFRNKMESIVNK
jgi:hypothetical protein